MAPENHPGITRLLTIMARLRDPQTGCPWDVKQDFGTIAPFTIEEAYEVRDAIDRKDMAALREELGDLLFQVVFHAQMAKELGAFAFDDVVTAISEKMIQRHPHVFGNADVRSAEQQSQHWEEQKANEKAQKAAQAGRPLSVLDDIPLALPALSRALKLQKRAARVGFDWPSILPVLDKLEEEIGELRAEIQTKGSIERLNDEFGDMLFVLVNLGRHLKLDAEQALHHTNQKFDRRFRRIEELLALENKQPQDVDLAYLDKLWDQAKAEEKVKS